MEDNANAVLGKKPIGGMPAFKRVLTQVADSRPQSMFSSSLMKVGSEEDFNMRSSHRDSRRKSNSRMESDDSDSKDQYKS